MVTPSYWAGIQWSPPQSSQTKDGRATGSCFTLVRAQCGVLMEVLGWLAAYVSTTSTRLAVLWYLDSKPCTQWSPVIREQGEGPDNSRQWHLTHPCTMQTIHNTINQLPHKLHVLIPSHNHLLYVQVHNHLLQFMYTVVTGNSWTGRGPWQQVPST